MKIFFSVGEPSGDLHGANLVRELQRQHPGVKCVGFGGPKMQAAGCELHFELTSLAVMWIARVLANIFTFFKLLRQADRYFQNERPDAVVLIDYPGFNWWVANRAKRHGIPVYYFSPPQIWAWASWRVKKMRRDIDHVLSGLPFEVDWLQQHGIKASFVGHPYFDEVRQQQLDYDFIERHQVAGQWVTLLPGSRTQEVEHNLPMMLRAATLIRSRVPNAKFAIAAFKPQHAQLAQEFLTASGVEAEIFVNRTPELIHLAEACIATSGSVSLELLYQRKPTVVVYQISRFAHWVQQFVVKVRYITLINLLVAKQIFLGKDEYSGSWSQQLPVGPLSGRDKPPEKALFPEYLCCDDKAPQIAGHLIRWLLVEEYRDAVTAELGKLKARIAHGGATRNAAQVILRELAAKRPLLKPHFESAPATQVVSAKAA
jgi:lipid-A-disaccharide synthase